MKVDPNVQAHAEWIGFVQPAGLVVSATALVRAGAILPRRDTEGQRLLADCIANTPPKPASDPAPALSDFDAFARSVLGWSFSPKGFAGMAAGAIPDELVVGLPELGVTLAPDVAVREREPTDATSEWQLLVRVLEDERPFDSRGDGRELSPHVATERLLRETGVPAGLLVGPRALRLISAPRGESSGWLDFQIGEMVLPAGRPICAAMRLLLSQSRLLTLPKGQRLAALLADSRRFQNEVSEKLAEQVLHALYELLRGFQAAHDLSDDRLLARELREAPDDIYRGLLTVILRLVFLLYAEERDMLPGSETFVQSYSLGGLFERLRADAARHPDTMDLRYGAWPQLLALFRAVHDGAAGLAMPPRHGALFDPDRFSFLEGRAAAGGRQTHERLDPPRVADGTVYRALEKLLVLDGERISYRALDVEQIGSVYETMMGFRLELATGRSVAVRAQSRYGAPTTVNLDELLEVEPGKRGKWLQERADRKLPAKLQAAVKEADSVTGLHATLTPVIDAAATPDLVAPGSMVLEPSVERRKSGSYYTPRSLTEPIVRTTLEPVVNRLRADGRPPRPDELLELKVCDPAMGSGAFLVEACRQLAEQLLESWSVHGGRPELPPDEDEVTFARRLVAQRCLYGIDRNAVAVDLAKMSLWLATLAREHPFTFLDHALRHGDSLVGLTRSQIEAFHWMPQQRGFEAIRIGGHLERARELRRQIRAAGEDVSDSVLRDMWDEAQFELRQVRLVGDLAIAAFFEGARRSDREAKRAEFADAIIHRDAERYRGRLEELREAEPPLVPFHWEVELPEVFERERPGFDAIIGNPPFAGGRNLSAIAGKTYPDWLIASHEGSSGGADLVAHFFRRAFDLLRPAGTFGLIATNTIGQGDTRASGLRFICTHGGEIYNVRKRLKWPGQSAVVVSIVHVSKGAWTAERLLDGRPVKRISAYLFHAGADDEPVRLAANDGKSFQGSIVLGMGFTFDDSDAKGVATPIAEMRRLIDADPVNAEVIFPFIGYAEVATNPTHAYQRYVINFGERSEQECWARWPDLMAILSDKVKPERVTKDAKKYPRMVYEWWKYWNPRPGLEAAIADLHRVLVAGSQASTQYALAFLPIGMVYSSNLTVFAVQTYSAFATLQGRVHEGWARFFMSTLKDDLAYTPTTCFEPFPFPENWEEDSDLEAAGRAYYEHRATLMVANDEGLTKTYNRFHDPYEHDPHIERLRELHAEMDRAVLRAYGWDDVPTKCEFLLDFEIDDEEWGNKKKPYRLRWPDPVRDEVLARLIALNGERARDEARSGAVDQTATKPRRGRARKVPAAGVRELG